MKSFRFDGTSKSLCDSGKEGVLLLTFISPPGETRAGSRPNAERSVGNGSEDVPGSASLINDISSYLFTYLAGFHIPTHFIEKASASSMRVRRLKMIPLEVHVYNTALGAGARRLGLKDGTDLTFPIIEHYYKHPEVGRPLVNEFHMYALNIATPEHVRVMNRLASKTNVVLRSLFERRGLKLQSISLEFGITNNQIVIGDEISPRTCRFVPQKKGGTVRHPGTPEMSTYRDVRSRLYHAAVQEGDW
jgi:phosphoribosylaminoimidazole-succinocarboxamide synthase